jgi:hypothetical protein
MKKTNQEIIDAIVNASENSYIDKGKEGTTRFCLYISEDDSETVANGLREAELTPKHLAQLSKDGIVAEHHLDDYCLHIRIKDSFLTDEQKKESLAGQAENLEREQAYELEQAEKKHADKCVAMHDELVSMVRDLTDSAIISAPTVNRLNILKAEKLLKKAEQK